TSPLNLNAMPLMPTQQSASGWQNTLMVRLFRARVISRHRNERVAISEPASQAAPHNSPDQFRCDWYDEASLRLRLDLREGSFHPPAIPLPLLIGHRLRLGTGQRVQDGQPRHGRKVIETGR